MNATNKMPMAIERFAALVAQAQARADALSALLADHMGYGPDEVTWAHVGTVSHINAQLAELMQFAGIDPDKLPG